jgi:hypothetical protein
MNRLRLADKLHAGVLNIGQRSGATRYEGVAVALEL